MTLPSKDLQLKYPMSQVCDTIAASKSPFPQWQPSLEFCNQLQMERQFQLAQNSGCPKSQSTDQLLLIILIQALGYHFNQMFFILCRWKTANFLGLYASLAIWMFDFFVDSPPPFHEIAFALASCLIFGFVNFCLCRFCMLSIFI